MEIERSGHIPTFSFSLPSLRRTTATFSLPPFLRRKLKPPKGVFPLLFDDGSRQSGAEEWQNPAVSPSKPSVASRGGGHRERCSAKHSCFMLRRKGKCRRRRNFCKKNLLWNWQLTNLLFLKKTYPTLGTHCFLNCRKLSCNTNFVTMQYPRTPIIAAVLSGGDSQRIFSSLSSAGGAGVTGWWSRVTSSSSPLVTNQPIHPRLNSSSAQECGGID